MVPDTFVQLLKNPVHHPKLLSLDISNSMQTHMSDMLVESLAMKIDSEESLIIRSLLYACYEKVVVSFIFCTSLVSILAYLGETIAFLLQQR